MARSGPRFSKAERAQLKARIAQALTGHRSTWEIAEKESLAHSTVIYYVRQVEESWRREYLADMDQKKRGELARLAVMEREAWQAWNRSLEPQVETTEKSLESATAGGGAGMDGGLEACQPNGKVVAPRVEPKVVERTKRTRQTVGDVACLETIRRCIETRAKILGYSPDVKVEADIRKAAQKAAAFLGRPVEVVLKRAEEICRRTWGEARG